VPKRAAPAAIAVWGVLPASEVPPRSGTSLPANLEQRLLVIFIEYRASAPHIPTEGGGARSDGHIRIAIPGRGHILFRKRPSRCYGLMVSRLQIRGNRGTSPFKTRQLDARAEEERVVSLRLEMSRRESDEVWQRSVTGCVSITLVAKRAPEIEPRAMRLMSRSEVLPCSRQEVRYVVGWAVGV
jgi:hypothetical protein